MARRTRQAQVAEEQQALESIIGNDPSESEVLAEVFPVQPEPPPEIPPDFDPEVRDMMRKDLYRKMYGTEEPTKYERSILSLKERADYYATHRTN
jgi:hypothetical protein